MSRSRKAFMVGLITALVAGGAIVAIVARHPAAPHVQLVVASDGALIITGVPGRTMRSQVQDPRFWNGSAGTSARLVEWLRAARYMEEHLHTFDGRIGVLVDDHASILMLKMLVASARAVYPEVAWRNGTVTEVSSPRHVKDCTGNPLPPGCGP